MFKTFVKQIKYNFHRFILFEVDDSEEEQEKAQLRSRLPKDLLNKYIVGKLLGHGTGGTVYLAYDKKRGMRKVAIKMAAITHANVREADILRKLTPHPCIIDIIEIFHTDTFIFMVLEYAKGGELFSYVVQDCKQDKFCERTSKLQFYQVVINTDHASLLFPKGKEVSLHFVSTFLSQFGGLGLFYVLLFVIFLIRS